MLTLHISHNDLDGVSCGLLIKKFLPGTIDTVYLGYDSIEGCIRENSYKYDKIIITDVSPSYGAVEMLAGEKDIIIIDHHASSEKLKEFPFTIHDISKSATMLTYLWLQKQNPDIETYYPFVKNVDDIDMWHIKGNETLKLSVFFNILGIERFEKRFNENPSVIFTENENLIIDLEEERREHYISKAMRNIKVITDKKGYKVAILFAENYGSELGNRIIVENIADYVLMINPQGKKASLRSRSEVDIREIAEYNGGGGHKNAAGFPLNNYDFSLDEILHNSNILE